MKTVLTVSDSDPIGGEGIQADIKTLTAHGVYATSVITAMTAQNTVGVSDTVQVAPEFLNAQLDAVFTDINPDAVKIGMISSPMLIYNLSQKLKEYGAKNIVIDPVAAALKDTELNKKNTLRMLLRYLFPLAAVITPNIDEAEIILSKGIGSKYDMSTAAKLIGDKFGCAALVKGGQTVADADDVLYFNGKFTWLDEKNIPTANNRGLGTAFASAIAANLAKGYAVEEAIRRGKEYITGTLTTMLDLGKGTGPVDHMFDLNSRFI